MSRSGRQTDRQTERPHFFHAVFSTLFFNISALKKCIEANIHLQLTGEGQEGWDAGKEPYANAHSGYAASYST